MSKFRDLVYRDDELAKRESAAGQHHSLYWVLVLMRLMARTDLSNARIDLAIQEAEKIRKEAGLEWADTRTFPR